MLQPHAAPMEEIMPGMPLEERGPFAGPGGESLEQIIEAHEIPDGMPDALDYDDSLMTPEFVGQEMGEDADQMEPMEPYPDPFGHYGGMMPQEMYDEPMQYMMDPYMAPCMIDPYMMPGPGPGGP